MFERFTERARQVVVLAQDEARILKHDHIGTEHLLLGLIREEDGVAGRVLREAGLELGAVRELVRGVVGQGQGTTPGQIPFTARAKGTLEAALREALSLGQNHIGTEHILLGLVRDPEAAVAVVLDGAGVDVGGIVSAAVRAAPPRSVTPGLPPEVTGFERFTERAQEVVALAEDEARTLTHSYLGTEHILLGLLREHEGLAALVLHELNVPLEEVRAQVARIVGVGDEVVTGTIPFTPRAKKVLELALREALSLGHNHIGTEHILLGLVCEREGVAVRILRDFGADAERIRGETIRMLSSPGPRSRHPSTRLRCPSCGAPVVSVALTTIPSVGLVSSYDGPVTCRGCGARYDLCYSVEWRPR